MVLEALYSKGEMSVGSVMEKILSSVGTILVIINNLVKMGYVIRQADKKYKRVTMLHLTDSGKEVIARIVDCNDEMIEGILDVLSDDEKEKLLNILKRIGGYYG